MYYSIESSYLSNMGKSIFIFKEVVTMIEIIHLILAKYMIIEHLDPLGLLEYFLEL
jgi:hypothetical protein